MRRVLQQTELVLTAAAFALGALLTVLAWLPPPANPSASPVIEFSFLGMTAVAGVALYAAWRHGRQPGRLRWLGAIWLAGALITLAPAAFLMSGNLEAGLDSMLFAYVGLGCLAAGVVGFVRELIPRASAAF